MDEQKKRLMELVHDAICMYDELIEECHKEDAVPLTDDFEYIADYLLTNGVLVPPCKVGDTVYYITHVGKRKVKSAKVEKLYFAESRCRAFVLDKEEMLDFTINIEDCFLTREEAEAALAMKEKE